MNAEPLLDLCPHCGAHFSPRQPILQRISQLEKELKTAYQEIADLEDELIELGEAAEA
jgi:hypothetical protein